MNCPNDCEAPVWRMKWVCDDGDVDDLKKSEAPEYDSQCEECGSQWGEVSFHLKLRIPDRVKKEQFARLNDKPPQVKEHMLPQLDQLMNAIRDSGDIGAAMARLSSLRETRVFSSVRPKKVSDMMQDFYDRVEAGTGQK